jgi:hypothetical protein
VWEFILAGTTNKMEKLNEEKLNEADMEGNGERAAMTPESAEETAPEHILVDEAVEETVSEEERTCSSGDDIDVQRPATKCAHCNSRKLKSEFAIGGPEDSDT